MLGFSCGDGDSTSVAILGAMVGFDQTRCSEFILSIR